MHVKFFVEIPHIIEKLRFIKITQDTKKLYQYKYKFLKTGFDNAS